MNPLFIPLNTEYYNAFADGTKTDEYRRYGPRWNEKTCFIGRDVILSKGYGKQSRMTGTVVSFKACASDELPTAGRIAADQIFGPGVHDMACIVIKLDDKP